MANLIRLARVLLDAGGSAAEFQLFLVESNTLADTDQFGPLRRKLCLGVLQGKGELVPGLEILLDTP